MKADLVSKEKKKITTINWVIYSSLMKEFHVSNEPYGFIMCLYCYLLFLLLFYMSGDISSSFSFSPLFWIKLLSV